MNSYIAIRDSYMIGICLYIQYLLSDPTILAHEDALQVFLKLVYTAETIPLSPILMEK